MGRGGGVREGTGPRTILDCSSKSHIWTVDVLLLSQLLLLLMWLWLLLLLWLRLWLLRLRLLLLLLWLRLLWLLLPARAPEEGTARSAMTMRSISLGV
jgi:hypothetical protein